MFSNRITKYLEAEAMNPPRTKLSLPTARNTVAIPSHFAPVPASMLAQMPSTHLAWQTELYRMAYEAAVASTEATTRATAERSRWN